MKRPESRQKYARQAAKAAEKLFSAIQTKQFLNPSIYSLLVFKIQQDAWVKKGIPGTVDYQYWQQNGWLDPHTHYYFPSQSNPIKIVFTRLLGSIIEKFVI